MNAEIEQRFYQHLISLGFSPEAIVYQPAFRPKGEAGRWRPDFAIIDPASKKILAILEIKSRRQPDELQLAATYVRQYVDSLGNPSVQGFVAVADEAGEGFTFYAPGDGDRPVPVPPPAFATRPLVAAQQATEREQVIAARKKGIDTFLVVCFVAAGIAFLVVIMDVALKQFFGFSLLTTERMALVGAGLALLVLPFAQKLKMLGVEFERPASNPPQG